VRQSGVALALPHHTLNPVALRRVTLGRRRVPTMWVIRRPLSQEERIVRNRAFIARHHAGYAELPVYRGCVCGTGPGGNIVNRTLPTARDRPLSSLVH
jgi:hypothetical protein